MTRLSTSKMIIILMQLLHVAAQLYDDGSAVCPSPFTSKEGKCINLTQGTRFWEVTKQECEAMAMGTAGVSRLMYLTNSAAEATAFSIRSISGESQLWTGFIKEVQNDGTELLRNYGDTSSPYYFTPSRLTQPGDTGNCFVVMMYQNQNIIQGHPCEAHELKGICEYIPDSTPVASGQIGDDGTAACPSPFVAQRYHCVQLTGTLNFWEQTKLDCEAMIPTGIGGSSRLIKIQNSDKESLAFQIQGQSGEMQIWTGLIKAVDSATNEEIVRNYNEAESPAGYNPTRLNPTEDSGNCFVVMTSGGQIILQAHPCEIHRHKGICEYVPESSPVNNVAVPTSAEIPDVEIHVDPDISLDCPSPFYMKGNKCVGVTSATLNWQSAKKACWLMGHNAGEGFARLIHIKDMETEAQVHRIRIDHQLDGMWTGLTREKLSDTADNVKNYGEMEKPIKEDEYMPTREIGDEGLCFAASASSVTGTQQNVMASRSCQIDKFKGICEYITGCPFGYRLGPQNKCFKLTKYPGVWTMIKEQCEEKGATLAQIHDAEIEEYMHFLQIESSELDASNEPIVEPLWVGMVARIHFENNIPVSKLLNSDDGSGGTTVTFQPNVSLDPNAGLCVALMTDNYGGIRLSNTDCHREYDGVCVKELQSHPPASSCPSGFISSPSGGCFKVVDTVKSWSNQLQYCRQQGKMAGGIGRLAIAQDSATYAFFAGLANYNKHWIGVRKIRHAIEATKNGVDVASGVELYRPPTSSVNETAAPSKETKTCYALLHNKLCAKPCVTEYKALCEFVPHDQEEPELNCPRGFLQLSPESKTCVKFHAAMTTMKSFDMAMQRCNDEAANALGRGKLVSIPDEMTQKYIIWHMKKHNIEKAWVGLKAFMIAGVYESAYDVTSETTTARLTKDRTKKLKWIVNATISTNAVPFSAQRLDEIGDCYVINSLTGRWESMRCELPMPFVCQYIPPTETFKVRLQIDSFPDQSTGIFDSDLQRDDTNIFETVRDAKADAITDLIKQKLQNHIASSDLGESKVQEFYECENAAGEMVTCADVVINLKNKTKSEVDQMLIRAFTAPSNADPNYPSTVRIDSQPQEACWMNDCENGGLCIIDDRNGFSYCSCTSPFYGEKCEKVCESVGVEHSEALCPAGCDIEVKTTQTNVLRTMEKKFGGIVTVCQSESPNSTFEELCRNEDICEPEDEYEDNCRANEGRSIGDRCFYSVMDSSTLSLGAMNFPWAQAFQKCEINDLHLASLFDFGRSKEKIRKWLMQKFQQGTTSTTLKGVWTAGKFVSDGSTNSIAQWMNSLSDALGPILLRPEEKEVMLDSLKDLPAGKERCLALQETKLENKRVRPVWLPCDSADIGGALCVDATPKARFTGVTNCRMAGDDAIVDEMPAVDVFRCALLCKRTDGKCQAANYNSETNMCRFLASKANSDGTVDFDEHYCEQDSAWNLYSIDMD